MSNAIFINKEGKGIHVDGIESHIALANEILKRNKQLNEEFKKSGKVDPVDFFICNKGFIKVNQIGCYKKVSYFSRNVSEKQLKIIGGLADEGFELDDRLMDKYGKTEDLDR